MNSYRRCQIIKSDEVFVKEQIMQFLYASLVPFHYRFASLLFMLVPRSAVASIVLKIMRQIFVFFEAGALNENGWSPPLRVIHFPYL